MSYPTSVTGLGSVIQDSDGSQVEVYTVPGTPYQHRLAVASKVWPVAPTGGVPISAPGAPTAGAAVTDAGHYLQSSGDYTWALTNVTPYGETTAGANLHVADIGASSTGKTLNLPAISQGTIDVPVTSRRLYRTTNGGSQLKLAAELLDAAQTTWVDGRPDDDLGQNVPVTNTSGLSSSVVLSGAATTWVEMPPGTSQGALTAGQYVVDYGLDPASAGSITHATADVGKSVTATYTAATVITSTVLGSVVTGLKETEGVLGATPQGAYADASARLSGAEGDLGGLYGTFPAATRAITQVGSLTITSPGQKMALLQGDTLLVPRNTGLSVVSVADPTSPSVLHHQVISGATQCTAVATAGNLVFVTYDSGVYTFALDRNASPTPLFANTEVSPMTDALAVGRGLYTTSASINQLRGYDLANKNPAGTWLNVSYPGLTNASWLAMAGEFDWLCCTQPSQNRLLIIQADAGLGVSAALTGLSSPQGIVCVGRYVYIAQGNGTLATVDVGDPYVPTLVGTTTLTGNSAPNQVVAAGGYLFVSGAGVVSVVSIKHPAAPTLVTTFNVGGSSTSTSGLCVWDRYLGVLDRTNNLLRIFDLSGLDLAAATIGTAGVGALTVHDGARVRGGLDVDHMIVGGVLHARELSFEGLIKGVRQVQTFRVTADISVPNYQGSGDYLIAHWAEWSTPIAVTLTDVRSDSKLLCLLVGTVMNTYTSLPMWLRMAAYGTGQSTVTEMGYAAIAANALGGIAGLCVLSGLSGVVTVHQVMNTGGPGSANWVQCQGATGVPGRGDCLTFVVVEFA